MDILLELFSASITMTGFISVFLVFRYEKLDAYVDNRKPLLISLLETQIQNDPRIVIRIMSIGKDPNANDIEFFSQFNNEAVNNFVEEILTVRRRRAYLTRVGITSIIVWGLVSLFHLFSSFLYETSIYTIITGISVILFIGAIVLTLYFIWISL